jgi:hypothetical protein
MRSPSIVVGVLSDRHGRGGSQTTCIAIDPAAGEISYASAGHPPALLRDDESGSIVQLDGAQAPPLGATDRALVREARLPLPRRDLADRLIREVAEVTAADDDIALLVLRFSGASARGGDPVPPA